MEYDRGGVIRYLKVKKGEKQAKSKGVRRHTFTTGT